MRSRYAAVALTAVAVLGSTGCLGLEKQNPFITLTAHGVSVKARAQKYCRANDCRVTTDTATITVQPGDTLGIDVPRSVAEHGWRLGQQGEFSHDHYRSVEIGSQFQSGQALPLEIHRNDAAGEGVWKFTVQVK
ncbi:MAG TPA: DUF2771 family protein [Mycobacteriales bacterium]|jgi:hypothetical protein|nr:DUF2771 family protein [Mycobacteriales bacterium]